MTKIPLRSAEDAANFLEYVAIAKPGTPLGISSLTQVLEEFTEGESHLAALGVSVLVRRKNLLGDKYPFQVANEYLLCEGPRRDNFYYLFTCLSSKTPIVRSPELGEQEPGRIFENLAQQCFDKFFGPSTGTLNFGYNVDPSRPGDFDSAVKWAADKIGVPIGAGYRQPRRKDGGVDVFVWKSFSDKFPGNILLLLQCTVMDDFTNKVADIDKRLWASWLSSDIDPVIGLAVPHLVTDTSIWSEINTRGILFDRARLSSISSSIPVLAPGEHSYFSSFENRLGQFFA